MRDDAGLGVGLERAVPERGRCVRDAAGVGDGRGARGDDDGGGVVRRGVAQWSGARQRGEHGVGEHDGVGVGHGRVGLHGVGACRRHGVRVERVGVGLERAVPERGRCVRDAAGVGDGRRQGRHHDRSRIVRRGVAVEREEEQRGEHGVGEHDGVGVGHGRVGLHGVGACRRHGVRVERVGVGLERAVPERGRCVRDAAGVGDGRGARGDDDGGGVVRRGVAQWNGARQRGEHGVGEHDGVGVGHGRVGLHGVGACRRHGVRDDAGLGVGLERAVPERGRCVRDAAGVGDGRGARGDDDGGGVVRRGVAQWSGARQRGEHGVGEHDGVGVGHGRVGLHGVGACRRHGVRVDAGLGVGLERAVPERGRCVRDAAGVGDGRGARGDDDGGGVVRRGVALSSVTRSNAASTGSVSMTVSGSGMGVSDYTGSARVGGTACESSEWESDSSVRCLSAGGVYGTLRVSVTAGGRAGTTTEAASYDVASLSSVKRSNAASTGSVSMTVSGSGMGVSDYTGSARVGGTACETTLGWESDSSVRCLSAGGVYGTLRVSVTAGGQRGHHDGGGVSYDVASLSSARRSNAASTGSVSMTVSGSGMGVSDYTGSARVGGTACETTLGWESDSSVRCLSAGGVYGTLRVSVTAGGRAGTTTEAASYDVASPSGAVRGNAASTGSVSMTVSGSGMGVSDYTGSARVGGTACETTLGWESDSSVRCLSAGGVYGTLRVSVTAGGRAGTTTEAASYDVASLVERDEEQRGEHGVGEHDGVGVGHGRVGLHGVGACRRHGVRDDAGLGVGLERAVPERGRCVRDAAGVGDGRGARGDDDGGGVVRRGVAVERDEEQRGEHGVGEHDGVGVGHGRVGLHGFVSGRFVAL